jgi:hypothetical protein
MQSFGQQQYTGDSEYSEEYLIVYKFGLGCAVSSLGA